MTAVAASTSIVHLVRQRATDQPEHRALVVDDGTELTLGEWLERAEHLARVLVARGLRRGDRIALVIDPGAWIEYAVANLAVYLVGGVGIGFTDRLGADTVDRLAADCDAAAVLRSAGVAGRDDPDRPWWGIDELTADRAGSDDLPDLPDPAAGDGTDRIAEIVHTSGTTGPAKRVAVTHGNLTFGRDSSGELFGGIESILCAVPPGTNAGHSALVVALTTGSRAHVLRSIDPDAIAAAVARDGIQHAILPPAAAAELVHSGATDRYDLTSLRALMFGSSAVPDSIVAALSQAIPTASIMIGYGSTESAPAFARRAEPAFGDDGDVERFRTAGYESLGAAGGGTEVRIVDDAGEPVAAGTIGEIALRSEAPRRFYLDVDERTAGVFAGDGWVRMGDLGVLDPDGTLRFVDRVAESIVSDGRRISSAQVENALMWHPGVRAAAVFAVPDHDRGQLAEAAVETEGDVHGEDLLAFLADRLAPADLPARVHVVDRLPRGVTGKVHKQVLREQYGRVRS
ncbi:Acyl-CoA synthetase (AMP-forming)/AMP-acid ligase II [Jatrophihabitans endophyticus]|uniref:Acyl-CoA synthetase (AMP-forming)/AMP-acid ligase II n=1 Tax=Jatrophihabitans endophyticus TaxID=1206085 RepID=A0A1M5I4A2_9ACTN|nr:class I adenylate-forming enzyme family protein [Jatrophihabitans endophyticus]SHG23136.1 Acyl-CoA synthetase (AMP-forming)/AMP-acid ligase II [Jatrophihabitans endophyticus]